MNFKRVPDGGSSTHKLRIVIAFCAVGFMLYFFSRDRPVVAKLAPRTLPKRSENPMPRAVPRAEKPDPTSAAKPPKHSGDQRPIENTQIAKILGNFISAVEQTKLPADRKAAILKALREQQAATPRSGQTTIGDFWQTFPPAERQFFMELEQKSGSARPPGTR